MTRTVDIAEAKTQLAPLANEVSRQRLRIVVADSGTPLAALVSLDDLERLARIDAEREARFAVVDRMREAFADVSTEEIEREVAKALAEVRAEMAAEREAAAQQA
jgi:prevent-host-death family protein